jgi:DNA mismatch repair protein MutS2
LDEFLRDSQAKVEKLLAKINANPDEEEMRAAYHKLSGLRKELKDKADLVDQRNVASQPSPEALHVGQTVHVRSVDADGIVTSILGHGKLSVDVSGIRLSTDVGDIEVRHRQQIDREGKHSFRVSKLPSSNVSLQLNVRGMTVAEALHEVEKYLDQLLLSDIKSASILHGKGTGALREAIREYLRSSSFVSSYGPGTQREGGEGITVFTIAGE